VALAAKERGGPKIVHQLLIYPVTDTDFDTASYRENGEGYMLTREAMKWYWGHYLGGTEGDHLAAPGRAKDASGLPPATVLTAEYDPLRDEAETYARAMAAAGGEVALKRFPGVFHGFVSMPTLARGQEAREFIAERLKGAA
jgi:acetyl esterase